MTAAVASHRLRVAGDRVIGHAAPADGLYPCVLRLEADGAVIAIARATSFSTEAAAAGLRHGWCGVELPGLSLAAALADVTQVRCHRSDRLLFEADLAAPSPAPAPTAPLTVADLIAHARRHDECTDIDWILPFAHATLRLGGVVALIDATYRSLLQRAPDAWITAAWTAQPPPDPVRALLLMILTSPEYQGDGRHLIPGPFHSDFAFDRSPLDD